MNTIHTKKSIFFCHLWKIDSAENNKENMHKKRSTILTLKKMISTSEQRAEHLFAGQNTQQLQIFAKFP